MQKIVINNCYGGFGLSHDAMMLYAHLSGIVLVTKESEYGFTHYYVDEVNDDKYFCDHSIDRDCPHLVKVVETLGSAANGSCADLKVVEIPDGVEWQISGYGGSEHVAEKHRTWS